MADGAFEVEFLNLPEFDAVLDKLSKKSYGKMLAFALNEGAKPMQKSWKEKARRRRKGRVPRSIRRRVLKKSDTEAVVAVVSSRKGFMGFEFGTSKQPPRPAARPAFDETVNQTIAIVRDIAQQVIEADRQVPQVAEGQEED